MDTPTTSQNNQASGPVKPVPPIQPIKPPEVDNPVKPVTPIPVNPLENLPKSPLPEDPPIEQKKETVVVSAATAAPKVDNPVKPVTPIPVNPLENLPKSPLPVVNLPPAPVAASPPPTPPAEVKKSPFRFLFPVLGLIVVGLITAFLISKFVKPKNTTSPADNAAAGNKVVVTYWGLWESSAIMEEVIAQFETANPGIDVVYQQQSIKDYRERLQNALAAGNGPDIFRFHTTWTTLLKNDLEPVPTEVLAATDFENQQYPVAKGWLKSGNKYLGIPLMYEGLGLYYNKQVFEAAGKSVPKTWEEMRRTALELTVKNKEGVIQRSGAAIGTTSNVDNWSDILGVLLLQNGANPANPVDELSQDALTFYTLFTKTDGVWNDSMPTSTIAFATEKAAMMIAPSWRAHEVRAMNPNLSFAIAELPQLPNTQIGWASVWSDGVASGANPTTKEAAWKFLTYLNQKETLRSWYASASKQRLFGEIFARKDMADQLSTDPFVSAYLKQAGNAKTWYLNSQTYDNGPNDKIIKYYEDAVNAVIKGDSAKQALATAQAGVAQVISQYKLPTN